ncbi:hypothetical protein [Palleronia sp.]|uniref:hypothetical protein n=1 Tax=Palleronia sp. TaxID=1940284 RepID=UPI0035C8630F
MTVIRVNETGFENEKCVLELAEEQFTELLIALGDMKGRVRKGEPVPDTEVKQRVSAVQRAMDHVFSERKRLDEVQRKRAGIVHEFAIDFDAARDEIGRRLARLRAASSAGDVPE